MCYIFNCFGWALDFLQRTLTFILACILCCIISIGIIVAICAGVAYGYNYSMAEFLTFTRQDVTVYMRRGQFYDQPDFDSDRELIYRRSGDEAIPMNKSVVDYQDTSVNTNAKALPDTWGQIKDTRRYAEELTKFSQRPDESEQVYPAAIEYTSTETIAPSFMQDTVFVTQPPPVSMATPTPSWHVLSVQPLVKLVSMSSNIIPTTVMSTQTPQIFIKTFPATAQNNVPQERAEYRFDDLEEKSFYAEEDNDKVPLFLPADTRRHPIPANLPPLPYTLKEISAMQSKKNVEIPVRHWERKPTQTSADYREETDEDNIIYKPI